MGIYIDIYVKSEKTVKEIISYFTNIVVVVNHCDLVLIFLSVVPNINQDLLQMPGITQQTK